MNGTRNIHQQQQLLIHTGNEMPQYEVTTTLTLTRNRIVDADGVETAEEQAEALFFGHLQSDLATSIANSDVQHDVVEMILPSDDAKQYA